MIDGDEFPLFPGKKGREIKAESVLGLIEAIALLMGEDLASARGVRRFGKHSFRATGAVFLASMGISIENIQLLGRWICGVVLHYTRAAPLRTLADDMRRDTEDKTAKEASGDVTSMTVELKKAVDSIMVDYELRFKELTDAVARAELQSRPRLYVTNRKSGKVHRVLTAVEDVGIEAMCDCSYKYARAAVRISKDLPIVQRDLYCMRCLSDVRTTIPKE